MTHAWYMPCDFHYFIIAIFLCLVIKKRRKIGLGVLVAFIIVSMVIPMAITIIYERPGLMHFYPEMLNGPKVYIDFLLTYSKSHTRGTPYFVGMLAGYVYYKLKGQTVHICKIKTTVIILFSLLGMLTSVFTAAFFYDPYHKSNGIEAASYAALHRFAWAAGSCGLFYVASYGHGNFLVQVLSWKPWIPLSKLVYGAYLSHMSFQLRAAANYNSPIQMGIFDMITASFSDMVMAFVTALCLFLMIEAPFRKVFREILSPSREIPPKAIVVALSEENMINNNNYHDSRL